MANKVKKTWLVVADGGSAQFYAIHAIPLRLTKVPAGALKASRKLTQGPAHMSEARNIAHIGNHGGDHQRHEDVFVENVAQALDTAGGDGEFDEVIVVLPPRALAHFRKVAPAPLKKRVKHEICGDWVNLQLPELERHLAAELP